MELTVKVNKVPKAAKIVFAGLDDFKFLTEWKEKLGSDTHPYRRDSLEFAQLAHFRYSVHSTIQPYAQAVREFAAYINDNPACEVACCVLLKCDWFADSET